MNEIVITFPNVSRDCQLVINSVDDNDKQIDTQVSVNPAASLVHQDAPERLIVAEFVFWH